MAVSDMMNGLKKKLEKYLYGEEAMPQQGYRPEENYAPAPDAAFSQQPAPQYAQNQAAYYQQPAYAPQPQQGYQQMPQPVMQPQPVPQQPQRSIFGARQQEKVLNIKDYQQPSEPQQQEEPEAAKQQATTRVVSARGMGDCRMAITLLRAGDAVLVTMENVKDPAEMRRLVDTLSGACYSLSASITKVSRYGVYLLAPQSMVVFADQMINQMNSAAPRQQQRPAYPPVGANNRPQPAYQQPQAEYAQPQQPAYQQEAYQPQQGYAAYQQPRQETFTQRMAAPQENAGTFYTRPQQQTAQMPAFSSQSANAGYVPDDMEVAE